MAHAAVNGQRIRYDDTGGDGPAVVLSHGYLMDRTMFDPQLEALAGDFRCIRWDGRGFGETEWDQQPFTYDDLAADCLGLLDHLGVEQATLVGMSQGGFLSLRAALRAPDRVRALVLIDSQAGVDDEQVLAGYRAMMDDWLANGPVNVGPVVAGLIVGDPAHEKKWLDQWHDIPREGLAVTFECLVGREDITHRLGEITCPALVVHGELDNAIGMDRAEILCDRLPACQGLVRVPGAAHASNLTHPDAVNPPLVEFLRAHA